MPSGQSHTTWFPELKEILRMRWNSGLTIKNQFRLVADLNDKLNSIRKENNIKRPMMWCPNCQKHHRSKFSEVSITAMCFALKKFEICTEMEFKELRNIWNKYSKIENVDIYGKPKEKKRKILSRSIYRINRKISSKELLFMIKNPDL